jgi:hypothetical protein
VTVARKQITDAALVAFIRWCRENPRDIVTNPEIARRVFNAYRLIKGEE